MSALSFLSGRAPRRTVRLRLTMLYLGLFVVSAVCLLVITYVLVAHQLSQPAAQQVSVSGASSSGIVIAGGQTSAVCSQLSGTAPPSPSAVSTCLAALQRHTLSTAEEELLVESGVALGIMALVSVGLSWLMAGRVLSPLRLVTGTARRISASNLDERIAMTGPDDELKELGDTFDGLLGRLEASFRAQRQFVANASHELRTPLARQRTLLEVALRRPDPSVSGLRTACERALAAGEESERLIAALLMLARSERGLDRFESLDLGALATAAVASVDRTGSLRLVTELGPAPVVGSPALAERLIANLVDNAVRYNVPGGQVEVATGTRDDRAFVTIRNTGPVIPPDDVARLFEPFERLDGHRTHSREGLGLGLAIVAAIATAHLAQLRATARTEGGLLVELTFPAITTHAGH